MQLTFQQKASRTITEQSQLLNSQQSLINMLKEQIRILEKEKSIEQENYFQTRLELAKAEAEVLSSKILLTHTQQNNESLLQTFQAYKKQYVDSSPRLSKSSSLIQYKNIDIFKNLRNKILINNCQNGLSNENINISNERKFLMNEKQSNYSQYYKYEFQQVYQRYWDTDVLILFKEQEVNHIKVKNKLRSIVSKKFFPEQLRHLIWSTLIQNKLMINQRLYYLYLDKIKTENFKQNLIILDLKRLNIKLDPKINCNILKDIQQCLHAFIYMRPDVGYVQGMPYFVWMLMIRMQKFQAFKSFTNLIITDKLLYTLFNFKEQKIKNIIEYFQHNLRQKRIKCYKHLYNLRISMDIFLIEWAYTFYCRAFPLSMSSKIWDLWLAQDYYVFFKVALTIFQIIEDELIEMDYENSVIHIRCCTSTMQEGQFFKIYRKQKLIKQENLIL